MPGRDHTGPDGKGPMTGRKLGSCKDGANQPLDSRPFFSGRGRGRGLGFRDGRGRGPGWRFLNLFGSEEREK